MNNEIRILILRLMMSLVIVVNFYELYKLPETTEMEHKTKYIKMMETSLFYLTPAVATFLYDANQPILQQTNFLISIVISLLVGIILLCLKLKVLILDFGLKKFSKLGNTNDR